MYFKINSTDVLDASVLVQTSSESAQTTHATACTLAQILMLTDSHSHVQEHMNKQGVFQILFCGLGMRLMAG